MILAFQQMLNPASMVLFDEYQKIAEQNWNYKNNRDLLVRIHNFLQKNKVKLSELNGIFMINGPGNFTPVRISCLIANTLASELDIPLFSLRSDELSSKNLQKIFLKQKPACNKFVEACFGKEPSIS